MMEQFFTIYYIIIPGIVPSKWLTHKSDMAEAVENIILAGNIITGISRG